MYLLGLRAGGGGPPLKGLDAIIEEGRKSGEIIGGEGKQEVKRKTVIFIIIR